MARHDGDDELGQRPAARSAGPPAPDGTARTPSSAACNSWRRCNDCSVTRGWRPWAPCPAPRRRRRSRAPAATPAGAPAVDGGNLCRAVGALASRRPRRHRCATVGAVGTLCPVVGAVGTDPGVEEERHRGSKVRDGSESSWSGRLRRPLASISRCRTRAPGATTTRAPRIWARQHRSRSSPMAKISGSNPPSSAKRSNRTSVQPPGARKTSRTASCWPWSISPGSIRSTTAPPLSTAIPTWSNRVGSSQLTSFGATTPALDRNDSSTKMWTASGSGATSSWQNNSSDAPSHHRRGLRWRWPRSPGSSAAGEQKPQEAQRHARRGIDGRSPRPGPGPTVRGSPGRRRPAASPRTTRRDCT